MYITFVVCINLFIEVPPIKIVSDLFVNDISIVDFIYSFHMLFLSLTYIRYLVSISQYSDTSVSRILIDNYLSHTAFIVAFDTTYISIYNWVN